MANDVVVNFDTMRDMVLNDTRIESRKHFQFKWDTKTKDIVTNNASRSIKSPTIKKMMGKIRNHLGGVGNQSSIYIQSGPVQ